jgi:hypothetical protein
MVLRSSRLTYATTVSSFRTSASADARGRRSARPSSNRPSTRWSADGSSRSSRWSGRCAAPIPCYRRGRRSSTTNWRMCSAAGIRGSGLKPPDPRLFGALHHTLQRNGRSPAPARFARQNDGYRLRKSSCIDRSITCAAFTSLRRSSHEFGIEPGSLDVDGYFMTQCPKNSLISA